ncbi:hypothetical protein XELAEV_18010018mg [Xenopus laevis]|uniref:Uncharacterized protein n=1 Tax=Xenopus laevis TaxID=8355 RepID=A0A974I0Y3_XENLA|nr:hypothetical protein XELAEV_18010018mg [Xenopus laevis]
MNLCAVLPLRSVLVPSAAGDFRAGNSALRCRLHDDKRRWNVTCCVPPSFGACDKLDLTITERSLKNLNVSGHLLAFYHRHLDPCAPGRFGPEGHCENN